MSDEDYFRFVADQVEDSFACDRIGAGNRDERLAAHRNL